MEEAFGWVLLIPEQRTATRRVIYARSLLHPLTDRHLYSWRKIAESIGIDHMGAQRLFKAGIRIIFEKGLAKRAKMDA